MKNTKLLKVGMCLATRDGQKRTNGIIIKIKYSLKVLTDFGNIINFDSSTELLKVYRPSNNWVNANELDYPFPSITERIDEQLYLLTKAKDYIING